MDVNAALARHLAEHSNPMTFIRHIGPRTYFFEWLLENEAEILNYLRAAKCVNIVSDEILDPEPMMGAHYQENSIMWIYAKYFEKHDFPQQLEKALQDEVEIFCRPMGVELSTIGIEYNRLICRIELLQI